MPNTPRMSLPYPNKDATDWYDQFKQFFLAVDAHTFAHREDRNLIMYSGATWTWDAGTGILSWDASFYFTGAQSGGRWKIEAGDLTIPDGYMMVVGLPRYPQSEETITDVQALAACEQTDEGVVVCVRVGTVLYFRTGIGLSSGSSINIFAPGGGSGGGNVEEHQRDMHSNGIVRSATSSAALDLSVTDGGGAVDDDLNVAAVPANDRYYVEGKQRTDPAAPFTYANPVLVADDVKMYRCYMEDTGDPQLLERATYNVAVLGLDQFLIVNCSEGLVGPKTLNFTEVVPASVWSLSFDGGPLLLGDSGVEGIVRLWSQDGVNWIDLYLEPGWDWTKVLGVVNVPITFSLAEVDPDTQYLMGTATAWHDGAVLQWGYGTTKETVDQRLFGNLGAGEVRDDVLQLISEHALTTGISGVIFDRKEGWTGRTWGGVQPRFEFPEYNFSLTYASPNITIHGGKLLVDGIIVDVPTTTLPLALTNPGVDYYVWYDRSDGTVKITPETGFPNMATGGPNPIAYILGGSISDPDYLSTMYEKLTRGVPLYVMQRGLADNQIDEATLCDLRRNVTKPALKAHPTVAFRPDWQTAGFGAFGNVPDLTQTESEFGCLDAAFRYIDAVPNESGDIEDFTGAAGPSSTYHTMRLVEVVGYTQERRGLQIPEGTVVQGRGHALVVFPPEAGYPVQFDDGFPGGAIDVMMQLPQSCSLKDLIVFVGDAGGERAAVGLGASLAPGAFMGFAPSVIENCQILSDSQIGVAGQIYSGGFTPSAVISQCLIWTSDLSGAGGKTGTALFFGHDANKVHIIDSTLMGDDNGVYVTGKADTCFVDRCFITAGNVSMGGGGTSWPNGVGIYSSEVNGLIVHLSLIHSEHARVVSIGGGSKNDATATLDTLIITGGDISGSGVNNVSFVYLNSSPQIMQDCYVQTPVLDATELNFSAIFLANTGLTNISRNMIAMMDDQRAIAYGIVTNGGAAKIMSNQVSVGGSGALGGVPVGISVNTSRCKIVGNVVTSFAGIGIEAFGGSSDLQVSKNTIDGGGYGNGIWSNHSGSVIEGNEVTNCRAIGIHVEQYARVYANRISSVYHNIERPEGASTFEEYGAWGIRYGMLDGLSGGLLHYLIFDNTIDGIMSDVEPGPNGNNWLVCGIGPTWETDIQQYVSQFQVKNNRISNVVPSGSVGAMVNTTFAGIMVKHPYQQIAVDGNQIQTVGGSTDAWVSFGIVSYVGDNVALPTEVQQISYSLNQIREVVGEQAATTIFAGPATQMVIDGNNLMEVWTGLGGLGGEFIDVTNPSGLTIPIRQVRVSKNAMDGETPPGSLVAVGVVVFDLEINEIIISENQIGPLCISPDAFGIYVEGEGVNVSVKINQIRWTQSNVLLCGIYVQGTPSLVNVDVDQNEIVGEGAEAGGGAIFVFSCINAVVGGNKLRGFDDDTLYGDGIFLLGCEQISVHDNIVVGHYPTAGAALVHLTDCMDGVVHDNVMQGTTGTAAPLSSLLCVGTGQGALARLHIHDNKIVPHGDGVAQFDMDFPSAAVNYVDLSIWHNVFGSTAAGAGTQNFVALGVFPGPYIVGPAPNNWTGAAFV